MAMKPILKFLVVTCVAANANYAIAKGKHVMVDPYLGLEYKLGYTNGKSDWKKLLPTNKIHQSGGVFAGIKFHPCLAGEVGYMQSVRNNKTSDVSGFRMFGVAEGPGSMQSIKLKYSNWNFDLNGQFPGGRAFSLLGVVGVGSVKPKLDITNLGTALQNGTITTITGKKKIVARLGVGVQYVKGMFGVRSKVMWENTSKLKLDTGSYTGGGRTPISGKAFKDSYSWTVGAFVRW